MSRVEEMARLRGSAIIRARGRCEWPACRSGGTELAHLTSRGMGGSRHRDRLDNVAWLCWEHARHSDGIAAGGLERYQAEVRRLVPDARFGERGLARAVAEALRGVVSGR